MNLGSRITMSRREQTLLSRDGWGYGDYRITTLFLFYYLGRAMTRYGSTCKTEMLTLSVKINTGYTRDQCPTHLGTRDQCPHSTRASTALIEQACPCSTPGVTSLLCPVMSLDSITPYYPTALTSLSLASRHPLVFILKLPFFG